MYFQEFIKEYSNDQVEIYVDMDGVIADYIVGEAYDYDKKRPLYNNLKALEEVSNYPNVTMHILSITKKNIGRDEKNIWLDKYAPFFKKENRVIISKEENANISSELLKLNHLKELDYSNKVIVLIDDDPTILHTVRKEIKDIVLLKDTALVD